MKKQNPMSVSMMVDQNKKQSNYTIPARKPNLWVPNEHATNCKGCSTIFTIILRKHHCRKCGHIFCGNCTLERRKITRLYQRVCIECAVEIDQNEDNKTFIITCLHLPLSFRQLYTLRLINKNWNYAVNHVLSMYRGIQYKLPCDRYTRNEMFFLQTHWHEFNEHSTWIVHAICALNQFKQPHDLVQYMRQPTPCRLLLCSRTCLPQLSIGGIIQLRHVLHNVQIQRWIVQTWQHLSITIHYHMMFWWVNIALECPRLFREGLIVLCSKRIELFYALIFECELIKNKNNISLLTNMQEILYKIVPRIWKEDILKSIEFAKSLEKLSIIYKRASYSGMPAVRLPWDPSKLVCGVDVLEQLTSSCQPVVVLLTLTNGTSFKCLLKKEDVRTDRLAMTVAYFINTIASDIVQTYIVCPLRMGFGCICMIPNVQTLYTIQSTTTVLNYILANNEDENIKTVRSRFIKSCAGASLLAFVLGLRDRHLQNMMIQKNAVLCHVDFGYILGNDPKYLNTKMRITSGMIEGMGGQDSPGYKQFVELISNSYGAIRLYSSLFFHLISAESIVFQDKKRPISLIARHCQTTFFPGLFNSEAELLIENIVSDSSTTTVYTHLCDQLHKIGQHFS